MSGLHSCKDCGVNFDSVKSLDVHLHYHKENLMSKWIQQATTSSEDNNNVKKNGRASGTSSVQPADSSESYYSYQQEGVLYGHQENGGISAFHRIRNFARYHPYQQQAVSSSSASSQCDKCGFVTDNLLEHIQTAHPPHPLPPFNFGAAYIKEEAQILDLDSQKVHVYPNGEEPNRQHHNQHHQNDLQQQPPHPPPQHSPWDNKFFEEPKKEEVHSPYHYQNQNQNHDEEKDKRYFEEKRYALEENGNGSPDFGGVSTTSNPEVMQQYYEPMREVTVPKLPPIIKPVGSASWKSNEARRPKTYNCTACNKWFTSSGHLKRHYNTTLHKNAVKQSGVLDPATLPISAHHHPPKEEDKLEPPPPPPPPAPFPNYHVPDHEPYQHPESFHYFQYPNALPPHVTTIGSQVVLYEERPLPSFQQGFHNVFIQEFNDVGGLYDAFDNFQADHEDLIKDDLKEETILPDDTPCSTTDLLTSVVPTNLIIDDDQLITTTIQQMQPRVQKRPVHKPIQTTVVSTTDEPQVHKCLDCDKTFNKACYLTQHNKSFHSGDKPFKCSRCGKRFTQEIHHLEHLTKHGGDKPHKCEVCPKQFIHKTDLRRHMCLHSGEKPFACDYCGKGFIRKDHMLKHTETHKRKNQHGVLQTRSLLKKTDALERLLDSNMNATSTLQVQ